MAGLGHPTSPARSPRGTTPSDMTALHELAVKMIAQTAGPDAGPEAVAAAAGRLYRDLDRVVAPIIGHLGVDSLTGRALHLAGQEYPCVATDREPGQADRPFAQVLVCLEQQDAATATSAAAAVFAAFTGLLGTFIGEPLTERLLRKAWPDVFSDTTSEERKR